MTIIYDVWFLRYGSKCPKDHDHMLYCSWGMTRDRCNCYFSFWAIFCPFTLLTTRKIKISKKWRKYPEISSFYPSVSKIMIIWYTVLEIWCMTNVIVFFHFGLFFALLPPLTTRKMKILKTYKKTPWDIIILHECTKNHGHMLYYSWDMARDRCKCSFFYFGLFLPFYAPNSSKNQNFKKMKKVPGDIIMLQMCTENYD